jgi:sugar lactone lactonase YvrE
VAEYVYQDSIGKQRINTTVPIGTTSGNITATANGITVSSADEFIITVPTYLPNVTVTTVASYGGLDVSIDTDGNLYVTNNDRFEIVKINPNGTITTLLSTFNDTNRGTPMGITVGNDGYVYATVGNTIRKIFPDGTVIVLAGSTSADFGYADGQGAEARFAIPWGITVDANGIVYVADFLNNKIRKITPDGTVTTLAGSTYGSVDGPSNLAQFAGPIGLTVDSIGNIYVAESSKIRKITPDGTVTTVAGSTGGYYDGPAAEAQFSQPRGIAIDTNGNMYITDHSNFVVRRISPDGMVVTVAGSTFGSVDGPGASAKFCQTSGIAMDASGAIYLTQRGGCGKIRKIVIN